MQNHLIHKLRQYSMITVVICALLVVTMGFLLITTFSGHSLSPAHFIGVMGILGIFILVTTATAVRMNRHFKMLQSRILECENIETQAAQKNDEMQKQLKNGEDKYNAILDGINDGYFESDSEGNLIFFNDAFCKMVFRSREEIQNSNFREFVPSNSSKKLYRAFNDLYNKKKHSVIVEHNFFTDDGKIHVHELSVTPRENKSGEILGFRAIVRDVSDRHLASLRLRESEERLNSILNSINAGIFIIDPETHTIVEANPAAVKMVGKKRDDIVGTICHQFICPAEKGKCPITDLGNKMDNADRILLNKDNNEIDILKSVLEIEYNGRKHLLESFIDISELKLIQNELKAAKDDAENANLTKSEFLANMSHELRTPLNHIIGFSELVLEPDFGSLNDIQQEYIQDIHDSSKHLLSLINDILDLSKVEAGKMELEASTIAIKTLLERSLLMVKEKTIRNGLSVDLSMDGIPDTIVADERKLKQIIYNLLSNSIKFTPDGGKVSMRAAMVPNDNPEIENDAMLQISVQDTGIGISPEDLDRVFNYFEQIENANTKKYQGTGIGLTLTKRLVELHGGRIWVESDGKEKGCTFTFTIPA